MQLTSHIKQSSAPILLCIGSIGLIIRFYPPKTLLKLKHTYLNPTATTELLWILGILMEQHVDLKTALESIQLADTHPLHTSFAHCKQTLSKTGNPRLAFSHMITDPINQALIEQGTHTQQLHTIFFHIASEYSEHQQNTIKTICALVTSALFIISGGLLCIGFYITITPMFSLLENILF